VSARELDDIVQRTEGLTADEKLQLAAILIEQARQSETAGVMTPRWRDLRGRVTAPALGEDAQAWVSRTRQDNSPREAS
jgi:hypothetical protein